MRQNMERYTGRGTTFKGCSRYVLDNSEVAAALEEFGAQVAEVAYITGGRCVIQVRDGGQKPEPEPFKRAVPKK